MNRIVVSSLRRYVTSPVLSRTSSRRLSTAVSESPNAASASTAAAAQGKARAQQAVAPVSTSRNIITALALFGWVSGVYYYTIFRMQGQVITNISFIHITSD
jgi:hypothetical protein